MHLWLLKFKFVPLKPVLETKKLTIINIIKSLENLKYFNQISTQLSEVQPNFLNL